MKKKILSVILSLTAAASAVLSGLGTQSAVFAAETAVQGDYTITYTVSGGEAKVLGVTGTGASLLIPEQLGGNPVTSIGADAASGCTSLQSLIIPDCVKEIGANAFQKCISLSAVSIGCGVSKIDGNVFSACPELYGFSVSSVSEYYKAINGMLYTKDGSELICFAGGNEAVIPEGTASVGDYAFFCKTSLTSAKLPESLEEIGDYAFSGCTSLESIAVPDSVAAVGKGSFMNCTSLSSADLGESVAEIPEECFSMCSSLSRFDIGAAVTSIGDRAFYSCLGIMNMYIPETVLSIGEDASGMRPDRTNPGQNIPLQDFFLIGSTGSAAESYALSAGITFMNEKDILVGDVNNDGKVTPTDASAVLKEYAAAATDNPTAFDAYMKIAGDSNGDGRLTPVDASKILAVYANNATTIQ
ncbi:MAG: leucine-rich repeat protein [Oscillospiraceae bacterium]|nr:leucine-rich repeat protein [Oscillospiraceae bacterium]